MIDSLLFIESPVQIMMVLVIALLLFGPKKLPEIGKQIGSALRELRRAGSEVVNSFNTDYEPDRNGYPYDNPVNNYDRADAYAPSRALSAPPDLTDYTIAGQPIKDTAHNGAKSVDMTDYTIARGSVDDSKKESDRNV